jgi:hypothetical protein
MRYADRAVITLTQMAEILFSWFPITFPRLQQRYRRKPRESDEQRAVDVLSTLFRKLLIEVQSTISPFIQNCGRPYYNDDGDQNKNNIQ